MDANKKVRSNPGYIVSAIIIGTALFGWMPSFSFTELSTTQAIAISLAKIGAFGGLAMFAWSLILSGRYMFFDRLFRGLDKMYIAHRFFGSFGLVLLVLHPLALTVALVPDRSLGAFSIWTRFQSLALVLGYISLYGMIGIVVWSIATRAKHETFIKVHRVLGFLFFAGVIHAFMAGSVLASSAFMFWYIALLSTLALLTFLHYSLFADILHPHYRYKVVSVKEIGGDLIDIRLKPKQRILNFRPGQFVYASFDMNGFSEYHPFSIASGNRSTEIQFIIKQLGDFTQSLNQLKKGALVKIKGPYGSFTFDEKRSNKQIWIAGGIGITPFLSKARSLPHSRRYPEIELVYATKTKQEAAFALEELRDIKHKRQSFNFTHITQEKFGVVSFEQLKEHFKSLEDCSIYLCGPPPMLKAYQAEAEALGLDKQLYFEEFSY